MKAENLESNKRNIDKPIIKNSDSLPIRFGLYDLPLIIKDREVIISIKKTNQNFIYKRKYNDEEVETILLTNSKKILINPVEPVNKPKELTPYILIEFEKPILIEPKIQKKVYLKFPIEIGVFIGDRKDYKVIDIFTFSEHKYTLYGEVRDGVICKYWKSDVYSKIPLIDPLKEGVIGLDISNPTSKWIELTKVVFNTYGMKLYYNKDLTTIKTTMKLISVIVAETNTIDEPLKDGMKQAVELYTALKTQIIQKKFVMEGGL